MEEKKQRLRETIEDILLKTGKHNQDECSELADVIIKDMRPNPGPVWWKASERLPAQQIQLHLKIEGTKSIGYFNKIQNAFIDDSGDTFAPFYVEWLDESGTAAGREEKGNKNEFVEILDNALDAGKKVLEELKKENAAKERGEDAVAFAQYLADEGWMSRIKDEWARYVTLYSDISVKTTTELYAQFKQQKKK